jgi:ATPase complex subunit ATP10
MRFVANHIARLSLRSSHRCENAMYSKPPLQIFASQKSKATAWLLDSSSRGRIRAFSTDDKVEDDFDGVDSFTRGEMQKRHIGIKMNKNGLSRHILPGDYVVKVNKKTGDKKMVAIERSFGYFWFLKDLTNTDSKPIVSNEELIPIDDAQTFPPLNPNSDGSLTNLLDEEINLPHFFTRGNRSMDPSAQCTLLAINFNEHGNKMLPSWTEPFESAFRNDKDRVKTTWMTINEGKAISFLKYFIVRGFKNIIPEEKKKRTLLFFGNCPNLRDVLRMHNNKTSYVYLLDGLGRVRWAGSGRATAQELERLIGLVKEMAPRLHTAGESASTKPKIGGSLKKKFYRGT